MLKLLERSCLYFMIEKIIAKNFKVFKDLEINFNHGRNIIVGENGVGKSTVLQGISWVLSGSKRVIEDIGIESLFNTEVIREYMGGERTIDSLPILFFEIYLEDATDINFLSLNGKHNSLNTEANGLGLYVKPNTEMFSEEIAQSLEGEGIFPFEYYALNYYTFSGSRYDSYSKKHKFKYEFINTSRLNSKHGLKRYVSNLFSQSTSSDNKHHLRLAYRTSLKDFSDRLYTDYDLEQDGDYRIEVNTTGDQSFENSLTATNNQVPVNLAGQGEQLFLGIESSLDNVDERIKIILLEEPENHLSYINMQRLINMLDESYNQQMIITTHDNMVASRLGIQNLIILSKANEVKLDQLSNNTNRFFEKSPNNNLLNYVLSNKIILVEGAAEYILLDKFYKLYSNGDSLADNSISLISVNGLNFKYYLEIAKELNLSVVVLTDNDKNYVEKIEENYDEFNNCGNIYISSDRDDNRYTFEVCLFNDNRDFLINKMQTPQMTNGIDNFMLNNKTEFALRLLNELESNSDILFEIPEYILEAFRWIDAR